MAVVACCLAAVPDVLDNRGLTRATGMCGVVEHPAVVVGVVTAVCSLSDGVAQ